MPNTANRSPWVQNIVDRRQWLRTTACGFGSLALAGLCAKSRADGGRVINPLAEKPPMFPARVKRVIFLFMAGGPSHVDTFDYKPTLEKYHGQKFAFKDARKLAKTGMSGQETVMKSMWEFRQYGETGRYVSGLFPEVAKHTDDLCFIHSLHTDGVAHGPSTLFLHTGAMNVVRPSVGSWVLYGLGTENENLPGFITIGPAAANGGPRNYSNAFLPTHFQGTAIGRAGQPAKGASISHLTNERWEQSQQSRQLELLRAVNQEQMAQKSEVDELAAVASSFELAWRMQSNAPEIVNIDNESKATQELYGIGEKDTDNFGRQCLLARRLAEQGVRYIQVNYTDNGSNPAWDQHSKMHLHATHAKAVDKPIAGLIADMKSRGLLEDTVIWWGGEFGRNPFSQGNDGRDHNPKGFTHFLVGGGVKAGYSHGSTDDFGHEAVTDKVHMHDLHATLLHLLGLDHERLTYRYAGRDFRLTDVHGRVVKEILA